MLIAVIEIEGGLCMFAKQLCFSTDDGFLGIVGAIFFREQNYGNRP